MYVLAYVRTHAYARVRAGISVGGTNEPGGFIRVCVVGAERIRSRSFDPPGMRPTSRPALNAYTRVHAHVQACTLRNV